MSETNVIQPTRIVAYDEGYGEWTIECADDGGICVKDADGHDLACWFNHEADDEFVPMSLEAAVAAAVKEFATDGVPSSLPVYVWGCAGMTLVGGTR